jgi:hypothetical protein
VRETKSETATANGVVVVSPVVSGHIRPTGSQAPY